MKYRIDPDLKTLLPFKFKKIITVDLNREPNTINDIDIINTFVKTKNLQYL